MIRISEKAAMWLWVDDATGICFPETLSHTEAMAQRDAERILGKRRMAGMGAVRAVRVNIERISDEETKTMRAEYAAWRAKKDAPAGTKTTEGA